VVAVPGRDVSPGDYVLVGAARAAIGLDHLFTVQLFNADYYAPDISLYYALTLLIPVGAGLYLRSRPGGRER
jgi:hypothetical protein